MGMSTHAVGLLTPAVCRMLVHVRHLLINSPSPCSDKPQLLPQLSLSYLCVPAPLSTYCQWDHYFQPLLLSQVALSLTCFWKAKFHHSCLCSHISAFHPKGLQSSSRCCRCLVRVPPSFHLHKLKEAFCKHCNSLPTGFISSEGEGWTVHRTSQEFWRRDAMKAAIPALRGNGDKYPAASPHGRVNPEASSSLPTRGPREIDPPQGLVP